MRKTLVWAIALLMFWAVQAFVSDKNEVVFVREYREYGWRYYGADSVKLVKPLQVLLDTYLVEYKLNSSQIIVSKRQYGRGQTAEVSFVQKLSKADGKQVAHLFSNSQPIQIARRCEEYVRDDGFHLKTTLVIAGNSTSFDWGGSDEPSLFELLAVVNKLVPQKFRFYELGKQEEFKKSVVHINDTP